MSVKTYYYCDRCAADIRGDDGVNLAIGITDNLPEELLFCNRCLASFRRWMSEVNPG